MGDREWRDACNAGTTAQPEAGFAVSSCFDRSAWCIRTNVGGIDCHWGTALLLYFWRLLPLLMNGIMRAWRYAECLPGIALSVLLP